MKNLKDLIFNYYFYRKLNLILKAKFFILFIIIIFMYIKNYYYYKMYFIRLLYQCFNKVYKRFKHCFPNLYYFNT
jgi:hypothetical protein